MQLRTMKYKICITLLVLTLGFTFRSQGQINYDGYYHTVDSFSAFRYYLRFYPDGTVIGVNTAGKPDNLVPWFKKENKTPYRGKYKFENNTIKFDMVSEQGTVSYEGIMEEYNRIVLTVKSLINKYVGREEYFFMRIETIK